MDFDDDQEDGDGEMASPTASSYDVTPRNSSREAVSGGAGHETASTLAVSGNRRVTGEESCRYRECQKNHAVGMGGHAVDGCGEYMPAGAEGTLDALRCAACSCHRNFHRKESSSSSRGMIVPFEAPGYYPPYYRTPAGYLHHNHHMAVEDAVAHQHRRSVLPLALPSTSGGGGHNTIREEQDYLSNPMMVMTGDFIMSGVGASGSGSGKKRFRTKFTQEQKDKMLAFAERVGWRIQKHDEATVQQFCEEACVKRHVLKVWMHNNKHTLGKKP